MMTRALSITCPVLLGCSNSKVQNSQVDLVDEISNSLLIVEQSVIGPEVILRPNNQGGNHETNNDNRKDEEKNLDIIHSDTCFAKNIMPTRKSRNYDPLSHVDPTWNRNLLDFPFFTHQKTIKYLSEKKTNVMFIMRGLPGSGKSTIVKILSYAYSDIVVCSADDYFLNEDGIYEFDEKKLGSAHGYCQNKAKSSCQNGSSIVVIDNTNVKRWEMKSYWDTAKQFGYIIILVEPKTVWKFNPEELFQRNKHGVPIDVLRRKVNTFDHIIPLYYGWFLSLNKSNSVKSLASKLFEQCLELFPAFQKVLLAELGMNNSGYATRDILQEILSGYYLDDGKTTPLLHCTARFCGGGKASGGKKYHTRPDVEKAYGQVYKLTLTGLVMTKKTMGIRVTLDEESLALFERPEEAEWVGTGSGQGDISALSSSASSLSSNNGKKKGGHTKISKKKRREFQTFNDRKSKENEPKLSLADMVDERIAEKKMLESKIAYGGSESDLDVPAINDLSITTLFPQLKNSGVGRCAHITVKKARNVSSVETNFDVLRACDLEHAIKYFNPSDFIPVINGKAKYIGNGICCVYFDAPIKINALFSGYY